MNWAWACYTGAAFVAGLAGREVWDLRHDFLFQWRNWRRTRRETADFNEWGRWR